MRWFWIDRFTEFVRHERATAIKAVTLAEEHLHDHFPGTPLVPATLVLEGMAQTAGILVADHLDFKKQVVLAKVSAADFHFEAVPGDAIRFDARIIEMMPAGSLVKVTSHVADRLQGEADLYFGHLEAGTTIPKLFKNEEMMAWLDNLRIFAVATNPDGSKAPRRG
jgi:3-hydroxyacyl-[acyl-carrier-protein] dehydratase